MKWSLNQIKPLPTLATAAAFLKWRRRSLIAFAALIATAALIADGLWVNNSDRWSHFTVADGLPSNRVVGVVADGDRLIAASDFGVAVIDAGSSHRRFQTIATLPELSSAVRRGSDILLCKDDGEILRLSLESVARAVAGVTGSGASLKRSRSLPLTAPVYPVDWKRPESLSSCQLASFVKGEKPMGETLMLMSGEGMWRLGWQDERLSGPPRVSRFGVSPNLGPGGLKSNVISALAFGDLGRLWAGSFRDGIDVIAPDGLSDGRRAAHLESEAVREINALVWDKKSRRMLAATAQGVIRFDGSKRVEPEYTETLPVENLTSHFSFPLRPSFGPPQRVGELQINVQALSDSPISPLNFRSAAYAMKTVKAGPNESQYEFSARNVELKEDFSFDYTINVPQSALSWIAHRAPERITAYDLRDPAPAAADYDIVVAKFTRAGQYRARKQAAD